MNQKHHMQIVRQWAQICSTPTQSPITANCSMNKLTCMSAGFISAFICQGFIVIIREKMKNYNNKNTKELHKHYCRPAIIDRLVQTFKVQNVATARTLMTSDDPDCPKNQLYGHKVVDVEGCSFLYDSGGLLQSS